MQSMQNTTRLRKPDKGFDQDGRLINLPTNRIVEGNALSILRLFPNESIDTAAGSPPYWGLRDYGTKPEIWGGDPDCDHQWIKHKSGLAHENRKGPTYIYKYDQGTAAFCSECEAWRGHLGLEPYYFQYVNHLCDIFDEVKRVLRPEGSLWVNIGDTYSGSNNGSNDHRDKTGLGARPTDRYKGQKAGVAADIPAKSLCQIPNRFAIEMTKRGWILRNEIIWHKPNCMPSSAKYRFTVDYEKIFFFTKSRKYYFNTQYDPYSKPLDRCGGKSKKTTDHLKLKSPCASAHRERAMHPNPNGRIKRTTWSINTKPFPKAHFAVYPEELVETPIKAGCPPKGIVLDPFMGSGTTALVALKLGRRFIGIELSPKYIKIAENRIKALLNQTKLH